MDDDEIRLNINFSILSWLGLIKEWNFWLYDGGVHGSGKFGNWFERLYVFILSRLGT